MTLSLQAAFLAGSIFCKISAATAGQPLPSLFVDSRRARTHPVGKRLSFTRASWVDAALNALVSVLLRQWDLKAVCHKVRMSQDGWRHTVP